MEDKKTLIYDCAKEIFAIKGFKDTNISDIAKMAGMAVGTFYNYYPSKEKLFMDIYLEENAKLKKSCLQSVDLKEDPLTVTKKMLEINLEGMKANPILKEWYNKDVFAKIERTYREQNEIQTVDFLYDSFLEVVKQWQAQGKIRSDIDSKMIMMIFAAIINVDTHKEEIGLEYFPQLMECLTELIFKGLADCSET
ncbi:TPA: TetR/AcrR family transcriptional regulator [Clostridium botulinum]|uniref:TetR/AcrR family transcriptional regulator n=1 Tax=Clostridium TaxID=1485 RepID=UPI000774DD41|nr:MULTISPECIES: TetR/AcrR family transcriptional regulator [Clostridium]AUM94951.1 TetR family transcriptional regulator [Clostridium sporogenes]AVQ52390.1 TetR/AcrR family transcriptional regulator [Clostridium botulinum]MBO0525176.1 TetR/AcrR family transcriptional regulator [Clostridium botulinum]MBO0531276.1 TetR/AcrR family transcriptional regulator [Clostridium botulinum]MBO0535127.1 TetR/AcrR family transcriptional regulator [Clostridium botulinum]